MEKFRIDVDMGGFNTTGYTIEQLLLEPKAWAACGKTRGWKEKKIYGGEPIEGDIYRITPKTEAKAEYEENMHRFIDLLIEGKDIEAALSEIK